MSLAERFQNLKPNFIQKPPDKQQSPIPEFYDSKQEISFLTEETVIDLLNKTRKEKGQEPFSHQFISIAQSNEENSQPIDFVATNMTVDEYAQSMLARHTIGTVVTTAYAKNERLKEEQILELTPKYLLKGGLVFIITIKDVKSEINKTLDPC